MQSCSNLLCKQVVTSAFGRRKAVFWNNQPMGCVVQLPVQLYKSIQSYKPSKLGHTDLVLACYLSSSVGLIMQHYSLYVQRLKFVPAWLTQQTDSFGPVILLAQPAKLKTNRSVAYNHLYNMSSHHARNFTFCSRSNNCIHTVNSAG